MYAYKGKHLNLVEYKTAKLIEKLEVNAPNLLDKITTNNVIDEEWLNLYYYDFLTLSGMYLPIIHWIKYNNIEMTILRNGTSGLLDCTIIVSSLTNMINIQNILDNLLNVSIKLSKSGSFYSIDVVNNKLHITWSYNRTTDQLIYHPHNDDKYINNRKIVTDVMNNIADEIHNIQIVDPLYQYM